MKKLVGLCTGFWLLLSVAPAAAQFGPPAPPAAPVAPAAPPPAAAPPPTTVWQRLGLTYENCERHRQHLCSKPIGQLLNSMTAPMGLATGGLIGPLCPPTPTADELARLLDPNADVTPAEAAAAKIKAMEAGAAARRAAVRYLGTVDCHYYPEAEMALIKALREDPNECVRWEAAIALGKGCCCTKNTVAALMLAATGSTADGNFAETSPRVKATALHAMNLCLTRLAGIPDELEPPERPPELEPPLVPPEQPPPPQPFAVPAGTIQLTAFYTRDLPKVSTRKLLQEAARVVAEKASTPPPPQVVPRGQRGLLQVWNTAHETGPARADIPFDEAALAVPQRSAPVQPAQSAAAVKSNQVTTVRKREVRASIGLAPARQEPRPPRPAPVPWPIGEPTPRQEVRPAAPAPVPWPEPQPVGQSDAAPQPIIQTSFFTTTSSSSPQHSAPDLRNFGATVRPVSFSGSPDMIGR